MAIRYLIGLLCILMAGCSEQEPSTIPQATDNAVKPIYERQILPPEKLSALKTDFATTPFKVLHVGEVYFENAPALAVTLSAPLDPERDWRQYFVVTQDGTEPVAGAWVLGEQLNTVYFPFIDADKEYTISVSEGLIGLTGRLLENNKTQQIRTKRSEQSVEFDSHGTQLSPALVSGITINTVNIDAVDVDFFRIKDKKIADFFSKRIGKNYYNLNELNQLATLVYSGRYDVNSEKNKRLKSVITVTDQETLKNPGIYFVVMKGAGSYPYDYATTWFSVSDIGFQVRQLQNQTLAFVNSTDSAAPVSKAQISFYDKESNVIAEGLTDNDGFSTFQFKHIPHFALAKHDNSFAVLSLTAPSMDLSEYRLTARQQKPLEMFLYSERDLYRPGERVNINALLRDHDGKNVDPVSVNVKITTPDNRTYKSFVWQADVQSYYEYSFSLPNEAMRGEWRFNAMLGNKDAFSYTFNVEDFLPEKMKLSLDAKNKEHVGRDETISIGVQGDYLYGAPASGNRISARVDAKQARSLFEQWDGFIFGAEGYTQFDMSVDLPTRNLDEKGAASLTLPSDWVEAKHPIRIRTEVSLFESGGRPVTRNVQQVIWPSDALIGIRPAWDGEYASPNAYANFELIYIDKKGEQVQSPNINVTVFREDSQYYWRWQERWRNSSRQQDIPVFNRVIDIDKGQRESLSVSVEYGHYRVEVRDNKNILLNSYRFFSGWRWDRPEKGETGRPDQVALTWNNHAYKSNDDAILNIQAPYAGTALITVESNELLFHKQIPVSAGDNVANIAIQPEWQRHDIYATVQIIRKGESQLKTLPKRAFGIIHLPLERTDRKLLIDISVPDKVLPESQLVSQISVKNANGKSVYVTLAAVDTGVLSLSQFKTPSAYDWFFAPRKYNNTLRDTWSSFIEQLSDRKAKQRFGGDSDELARGGEAPVSDVQIVSLFSGKVELNDKGQADIALDLPYFNGELRLMLLAWSDDTFGHHEAYVKVAAPLIAEISTPRFLAKGDSSFATFDIQNLTENEQKLDVHVNADDALGSEKEMLSVTLTPKQRHIFQLPISAQQSEGVGKITFSAYTEDKQINLEREWHVGFRPPYPAKTVQINEIIDPDANFSLPETLSLNFQPDLRQLSINVSPRPPINIAEHVQRLFQYPYGCLEQTTSRAWPLLLSSDSDLKKYDFTKDKSLIKKRGALIEESIGRISSMQRSDGSFGLWGNKSQENHWLTVYATEFLLAAKEASYSVDDAVLKAALNRLQYYVKTHRIIGSERSHYSEWPEHYHFSYRAYAALVIASRQQVSLGDLRTLYDKYSDAAKTGLPLAQIALALELGGDVRRSREAWQKAFSTKPWPQGYTGDYGNPVRDTARIISLALKSKVAKKPLSLLITLRSELMDKSWLSTQDRSVLYQLGMQLQSRTQKNWNLNYSIQAEQVLDVKQSDFNRMWKNDAMPKKLKFKNTNDKPLFLNAVFSGYPKEPPKPESEGISVQREFFDIKGKLLDINKVLSGDLILVRIDVVADRKRIIPDALVVDFLPAGLELENPNLASAAKLDGIRIDNKNVLDLITPRNILHEEYRDDRYVAAVKLNRSRTTTLFYLARAVSPGRYFIPPTQVEDMYRPWLRAVGESRGWLVVESK